jgi:hypothetical protein
MTLAPLLRKENDDPVQGKCESAVKDGSVNPRLWNWCKPTPGRDRCKTVVCVDIDSGVGVGAVSAGRAAGGGAGGDRCKNSYSV